MSKISMMLDITGSMCSPCTKIQAAQSAAKDLIDIVVWSDQSQYYSRVALAPFAQAVNVGTTFGPTGPRYGHGQYLVRPRKHSPPSTVLKRSRRSSRPSKWIQYTKASGGNGNGNGNSGTNTWVISDRCVTERIGPQAYTDAAPAGTSTYLGKGYFGTSMTTSCPIGNYTDAEVNSIQPLSKRQRC